MWPYLRHIFIAKGRHGTHSPFVYAFVEQVLRPKQYFSFDRKPGFTQYEFGLLCKTIAFLKIENVIFFQKEVTLIEEDLLAIFPQLNYSFLTALKDGRPLKKSLILFDLKGLKETELSFLQKISSQDAFGLYIFHPHQNKITSRLWATIKSWKNYPMSLDFWKAGLILQDKAFKEKQHFLLK